MQEPKKKDLEEEAEKLVINAMNSLRQETGSDLASCHTALLIATFSVMKKLCLNNAMFVNTFAAMVETLQRTFTKPKKETHQSPRTIQ